MAESHEADEQHLDTGAFHGAEGLIDEADKAEVITGSQSFEDLYLNLQKIGSVSEEEGAEPMSPAAIIGLIEQVRTGHQPVETVTEQYGLRSTVAKLMKPAFGPNAPHELVAAAAMPLPTGEDLTADEADEAQQTPVRPGGTLPDATAAVPTETSVAVDGNTDEQPSGPDDLPLRDAEAAAAKTAPREAEAVPAGPETQAGQPDPIRPLSDTELQILRDGDLGPQQSGFDADPQRQAQYLELVKKREEIRRLIEPTSFEDLYGVLRETGGIVDEGEVMLADDKVEETIARIEEVRAGKVSIEEVPEIIRTSVQGLVAEEVNQRFGVEGTVQVRDDEWQAFEATFEAGAENAEEAAAMPGYPRLGDTPVRTAHGDIEGTLVWYNLHAAIVQTDKGYERINFEDILLTSGQTIAEARKAAEDHARRLRHDAADAAQNRPRERELPH